MASKKEIKKNKNWQRKSNSSLSRQEMNYKKESRIKEEATRLELWTWYFKMSGK